MRFICFFGANHLLVIFASALKLMGLGFRVRVSNFCIWCISIKLQWKKCRNGRREATRKGLRVYLQLLFLSVRQAVRGTVTMQHLNEINNIHWVYLQQKLLPSFAFVSSLYLHYEVYRHLNVCARLLLSKFPSVCIFL